MKKVKYRVISALMAVVMLFTSVKFDFLSVPASAAVGFVTSTLCTLGYKAFALVLNKSLVAVADATGSEDMKKAAGLVNTVLMLKFGSVNANKMAKIAELCKQILAEAKQISADMDDSFLLVEQLLGEQSAAAARKAQDDKWQADVAKVVNKYNASQALEQYLVYMEAATDYAEDQSNQAKKAEYEKQRSVLLQKFALMYEKQIPLDVIANEEKLKETIFSDNLIDNAFINLINELSSKLVKTSSSQTLADTAAQTADAFFPFSHQQYQFIHTVIGEQLMELTDSILLAVEYYDLQGEYLLEKYGRDSAIYRGYARLLDQLDSCAYGTGSNSAVSRIDAMLNSKLSVSANVQRYLSDYMRPEDAESAVLQIQGFKDSETAWLYNSKSGKQEDFGTMKKKYIEQYIKFNRVMVNDTVYYIIDPTQFSSDTALSTSALEWKLNLKGQPDHHLVSVDYLNLIKPMSDGNNTFSVSSANVSVYDNLIATNSFLLSGSCPNTYLQGYIPVPSDKGKTMLFITSKYDNHANVTTFNTTYAEYWVINAFKTISTGSFATTKVEAKNLQPDHDGDKKKYSVILAPTSDGYKQSLSLSAEGNGLESAKLTAENGDVINMDESKAVSSGGKLSLTVKLQEDSMITSVKCIRDSDPFRKGGESTYEIIGADDFEALRSNADGTYTIDYVVPYSNARIVVETAKLEYDSNGFCTSLDRYQPAHKNGDGVYEIGNAGQLLWFAETVNGTSVYSEYSEQDPAAKALLTDDIDLENREWEPIKNFSGVFDGNDYAVTGLSITTSSSGHHGMFASLSGEIENLLVKGTVDVAEGTKATGGVVGYLDGGRISRVISEVSFINGKNSENTGGIVGICNGEVSHCGYAADLNIVSDGVSSVGGIAGKADGDNAVIKGCYSYGNSSCDAYGAIAGTIGSYKDISGNYYIDTAKNAFYSGNAPQSAFTAANDSSFKSGEIAYVLNGEVTDGTQPWYQNIDNRGDKDNYPKLIGGTVYKSGDGYTNLTPGHTGTFTGIPLEDVNIGLEPCEGAEEGYDTLVSMLGEDLKNVYRITVTHKEGDVIPAGKWTWKDVKISLSADSENVCLAFIDEDGKLVYCAVDSFENGTCTFVLPKLYPLIALCTKDGASDNNGDNNPPTGGGKDMTACIVALASLAVAAMVTGRKRKFIEQ